jgi:pectinesterase inhibitor-like protein
MTLFTIFSILHLLLTPPPLLVRANNKLIRTECHNAEVPATCMQCVESDRRAAAANRVGIATILVTCLENQAKTLAANMSELASSSKDPAMKIVFKECCQGYSSAEKGLSSATSCLKNGRYEDAERFVNEALEYELTCHSKIESYRAGISEYIVHEMKIYEQLSEAANRIVERL